MKKIYFYFIITVFVLYWLCTIVFVSPKNYITISLYEQEQFFNTFFFQKWGFFAPPPKHNDRLYFKFESKKDSTKFFLYEVIEPLQKRKSKKAPFNSSEDILDYILSSTILSITDGLIAVNESIDYKKITNDSLNNNIDLSKKIEEGKKYIQTLPSFQTLKNYGVFIARKHNVNNISEYNMTIEIIQVEMPKFADRDKLYDKKNHKSKIVFESDKISL
ncbi:hypothetical protein [Winogradskyella sp.]|uniref:hypothetical protein n=1 Tax=Winogradskyella sp. TaxID=1883156 RepID=UPI0025D53168|nr:hypothetical protein [Winogradskyella sp.]MBT8243894.1 hypothetical protein [Winogradskyella sp.]